MNIVTPPVRMEDKHVGRQIKARRNMLGLTQSTVADALGISFQQLQKYETGANRVSASKICDLSKVLDCQPSFFFEGIGNPINPRDVYTRDEMKMLTYMRQINTEGRRALLDIARNIADVNVQPQPILSGDARAEFEKDCG